MFKGLEQVAASQEAPAHRETNPTRILRVLLDIGATRPAPQRQAREQASAASRERQPKGCKPVLGAGGGKRAAGEQMVRRPQAAC
jgi:hypothetical protein